MWSLLTPRPHVLVNIVLGLLCVLFFNVRFVVAVIGDDGVLLFLQYNDLIVA